MSRRRPDSQQIDRAVKQTLFGNFVIRIKIRWSLFRQIGSGGCGSITFIGVSLAIGPIKY